MIVLDSIDGFARAASLIDSSGYLLVCRKMACLMSGAGGLYREGAIIQPYVYKNDIISCYLCLEGRQERMVNITAIVLF